MGDPPAAPTSPPATRSRLMVLMFTDLVGSTALKAALGNDEYIRLFERHEAILRQALTLAPSGQVAQDTGDGYLLTFDSVTHAVRAALAFQLLMAREPWPAPFASRVGLHLGDVDQRTKEGGGLKFVAGAIDLASRVMSLAQGGQILVTRGIFELARRDLREHPAVPPHPAPALLWKEHGPYLLKGSAEPMDVFEVGGERIAPMSRPPDSEKATRIAPASTATASRRKVLRTAAAAAVLATAGAGAFYFFRPEDPLAAMRRLQIERDVASAMADPPPTLREQPEDVRRVDALAPAENAEFEVISDRRTVDLRQWKEVPADKNGVPVSPVNTLRRLAVKKLVPATHFKMDARTSGLDAFLTCQDKYPFTITAQRTEEFVGFDRMKIRQIAVDVSGEPVGREFPLHLATTTWNAIQTEPEQWLGLVGYKKAFVVSLTLLFPPNRPFKDYTLGVARTSKDKPTEYNGERILLTGKHNEWIYWEVPNPQPGHVYRITWKW